MSEGRMVRQQVVVATAPELAFEAVTKASELREWFSDRAWTEVRPGGRYEVFWNRGYRAAGEFIDVEAPSRATFTWQGTGEPGETMVAFTVEDADDGGVVVTVEHSGLGHGEEWDSALAEAEKGWAVGLENLKSTLETGVDLRLARQPFLGIWFDFVTPELVAQQDLAVQEGIYLHGTSEDSGARAAGLEEGDVLVALDGVEMVDLNALVGVLQAHQAGDVIDAHLVRGEKRETVQVTLGKRPVEETSDTAQGLADLIAQRHAETRPELEAALEGLTEGEAAQAPGEGEWSVVQVLAHLSICERDYQNFLANIALSGWLDGGDGNPTAMESRLAAVLATTPTVRGLVERFYADQEEMVTFLRGLPEEVVRHKARFYRMGQNVAGLHPGHTRDHIEQIKRGVEAVRDM